MRNRTLVLNNDAKTQSNAALSIPKEELKSIIEAWLVFLAWAEKEWLPTVKENRSKIIDAPHNPS